MAKTFCPQHEEEFFELNPDVPENLFSRTKYENRAPYMIDAQLPNVQGCKPCMNLPANKANVEFEVFNPFENMPPVPPGP